MKYVVGIDVGGTNIKLGLLTVEGEIVETTSMKTESQKGYEDTLDRISNKVDEILGRHSVKKDEVRGIGLGIPGPVKNQEIVTFFANFPWERNLNVSEELGKRTGLTVKLDNDVNVITLGEAWQGAAKGYKNVLGLALGTGVGGGVVVDGKVVAGVNGAGGEVGHIILERNGKLCGCGNKGCFEAYASATAIIREATSRLAVNKNNLIWEKIEGNIDTLEAKHVFDAAREGDKFALDIVDYVTDYLALGIANIINVLNPEAVVIGGGVALAGDILFNEVREKIKKYAFPVALEGLEIIPAKLGNDAGVVGAAALIVS